MNVTSITSTRWVTVCRLDDMLDDVGVRALVDGHQIALFKVAGRHVPYAIDAVDPFCQTAVMSRGIVGDVDGALVVASPMYKQHFSLETGECLEDDRVRLRTFPVRVVEGQVQVASARGE